MYDVIIIGCGPAGLSAAIYTSRANLKTVVFGDPNAGDLYRSPLIANYFGFPKDITGSDLVKLGLEQAKRFGTEFNPQEVTNAKQNEDESFTIKTKDGTEHTTNNLIIAIGMSYKSAGILKEKDYLGKGLSYCVTCDGYFFKDKKVAVVGNGDFAFDEALELTNYTKDLTIFSQGKEFSATENHLELAKKAGIKLRKDKVKELIANPMVSKVVFEDKSEEDFEGIFVAVGTAGTAAFAYKLGLEMENNYIKIDKEGRTSMKKVFACGNCTGANAQIATSVGAGCDAAIAIIKNLRGQKLYVDYD